MARLVLVIAALLSLIVTALSGFFILPWLKRLHYGQNIKEVGPTWHNKKQGTPMMGGLMFILGSITAIAVAFGTLLVAQPDLLSGLQAQQCATLLISLMATIGFSFVGFVDDYLKVVHKQNLGLSARYKILMQIVVTTAYLAAMQLNGTLSTAISLPAIGRIDFGLAFYPLAYFCHHRVCQRGQPDRRSGRPVLRGHLCGDARLYDHRDAAGLLYDGHLRCGDGRRLRGLFVLELSIPPRSLWGIPAACSSAVQGGDHFLRHRSPGAAAPARNHLLD